MYGIGCLEFFDLVRYDLKRKMKDKRDGKVRCYGIFSKYVQVGDVFYLNEEQGKYVYNLIYVD